MDARRGIFAALLVVLIAMIAKMYAVAHAPSPEINIHFPELPKSTASTTAAPVEEPSSAAAATAAVKAVEAKPTGGRSLQDKIKAIRLTTAAEYREDVHADPDQPSPRLVQNVLALGDLMNSVTSESEARQVVGYYKTCVGSDSPNSLKIQCYRYSHELLKKYPSLTADVQSLDSGVPDGLRALINRTRHR